MPAKSSAKKTLALRIGVLAAGIWGNIVDDKFSDPDKPWVSLSQTYRHNGQSLNVLAADLMRYTGAGGATQGNNQINHGFGLDDFYLYTRPDYSTYQSWSYDANDIRWKYSMNTLFADGSVNTTASDPSDIDRLGIPAGTGTNRRWLVNRP